MNSLTLRSWKLRKVIVTNLIVLCIPIIMSYASFYGPDAGTLLQSFQELLVLSSVLSRAVFLIFSSVLLSKLTITEYRERTVLQLFTYPILRKNFFLAKLMIVFLFTVITAAVSCCFNSTVLYVICKSSHLFTDTSIAILKENLFHSLMGAVMCGFISLVPFYFGMRKKSSAATIISSVILTVILTNNMGSITLPNYMLRLLVIGGASVLIVLYTVCVKLNQLESSDV